jgi:hypothetical protein
MMGIHWANMSGGVVYQEPQNLLQEPFDRDYASSGGAIRVVSITASADPATLLAFSSSLDSSGSLNVRRGKQRSVYERNLQSTASLDLSWTQRFAGLQNAYVIPTLSASDHESQILNAYRSGSTQLEYTVVSATGTSYYSKGRKLTRLVYSITASSALTSEYSNYPFYTDTGPGGDLHGIGMWETNGPSNIEQKGRSTYIPLSGCYMQSTLFSPCIIKIPVTGRGKIVDIKVWVELVHDIRGGTGPITGSEYSGFITNGSGEPRVLVNALFPTYGTDTQKYRFMRGLGSLGLALRSPNVRFPYAHPLWNMWAKDSNDISGVKQPYAIGGIVLSGRVPEFFRNSYLLWNGHEAEQDLSGSLGPNAGDGVDWDVGGTVFPSASLTYNPYYAEFDTDIDMRTIFTDSSRFSNPRHLELLYSNPTDTNPGAGKSLFAMTGTTNLTGGLVSHPYQPFYPMPSLFAKYLFGYDLPLHPTGSNFPWFLDSRIPPGNFVGRSYSNVVGSPAQGDPPATIPTSSFRVPAGWLTGPGETAADNEFPTYGMQIGPPDIKPVYPLLENIVVEKIVDVTARTDADHIWINNGKPLLKTFDRIPGRKYFGSRPGLRGTEINGTWNLLISTGGLDTGSPNVNFGGRFGSGIWFRQVRLEFIVEQNEDVSVVSRSAKYKKSSTPAPRRLLHIMSGSAGKWDLGINYTYVVPNPNEYGRTVGITDNTGSNINDFAVFTRLTGTLADRLTGSGQGALYSYLRNEFGTPYIPISSGSGVTPSLFVFDAGEGGLSRKLISDLLEQKTLLKRSHNLQSVLSRNNYLSNTLARRSQILVDLDVSEAVSVFSGSFKLPS